MKLRMLIRTDDKDEITIRIGVLIHYSNTVLIIIGNWNFARNDSDYECH